jgi:hypothetical protein
MDTASLQTIANGVIVTLTPALLKAMSAAAKPIGAASEEWVKALGQAAGERAAALMKAISQHFQGQPAAEEAVADFVQTPEDQDVQAALRHQIKKALQADEAFAQELKALLQVEEPGTATETTAIASGERSVAAGRDVGGPVFTGDIHGSKIDIDG